MKMTRLRVATISGVFAAIAAAGACAETGSGQESDALGTSRSELSANDPIGTSHGVFAVTWPSRSATDAGARARDIAEVLLGTTLSTTPFIQVVKDNLARNYFTPLPVSGFTGLTVGYDKPHDDFRVFNDNFDEFDSTDIGYTAAKAKYSTTLTSLATKLGFDKSYYNPDNPAVVYGKEFSGPTGGTETESTNEYRFVAFRYINGIPFDNSFVRIVVHRSGIVSSIRVGGAVISSTGTPGSESPVSPGYTKTRAITVASLNSLSTSEAAITGLSTLPIATRFSYMVPAGSAGSEAAPFQSYSFAYGKVVTGSPTSITFRQQRAYPINTSSPVYTSLTPAPASVGGDTK